MKRNRNIYLLSALFFFFALVKYFFAPGEMGTLFIVFEAFSFLVILGLIRYVTNQIVQCIGEKGKDRVCQERQEEIDRLQMKLSEYEKHGELLKERESVNRNFLEQLKKELKPDSKTALDPKVLLKHVQESYEIMAAIVYQSNDGKEFQSTLSYGLDKEKTVASLHKGEGLHGQALLDNKSVELEDIPEDYFDIESGTGNAKPRYIYFLPFCPNEQSECLIEIASFKKLDILDTWDEISKLMFAQ